MLKLIPIFMLLFAFSACTIFQAETPAQRYYGLKSDYERALITAVAYKQNCATKLATDSCHDHVAKIRNLNQSITRSFETADNLGLQSASKELDAAIIATSTGLQELSIYLLKLEVN